MVARIGRARQIPRDCAVEGFGKVGVRRAGQPVRMRPKAFEVLCYLLEHRERVVSKDELCEAVWPQQFISDSTLVSTMRAVRMAIGDNGQRQRMIRTQRGHGYRFVAWVNEQTEHENSARNSIN